MIGNWPLLTIITFLPMIGVAFLMMIRGEEGDDRQKGPVANHCLHPPEAQNIPADERNNADQHGKGIMEDEA